MTDKRKHPVQMITWVKADDLTANDYNPNKVAKTEMDLLAKSILHTGWLQPLLITPEMEVIDGFHRATLAKVHPEVRAMTDGMVPVVKLKMSRSQRMMMTVRINRAKGQHVAFSMADIVKQLTDEGVTPEQLRKGMGMTNEEIEVLNTRDVFQRYDVTKHEYSGAWYADREKTERAKRSAQLADRQRRRSEATAED